MSAHRNLCRAAVAASCLTVAVACSNGGDGGSSPASPPVTTRASVPPGAPPGAEILGTARPGEPFTFAVTVLASNTTNDPSMWQFTVRTVVCGKPLDPAVMAHAADSVGAPTQSPTPEAGKQFCVLTMDAENVGKSSAVWDADDRVSLNVGDTRYIMSQQDSGHSSDYDQYWIDQGQTSPVFGLNPGSRGPVHAVFQIPASEKPTSLWVTSSTAITTIDGVEPGYLVDLACPPDKLPSRS